MKVGDRVKVIGIPPDVHDSKDDKGLATRSLFEKCLGKVFQIQALESVEGLTFPLVKLDVGHVLGKQSWEDTIWIEPEFVELAD
jgi:hypothetical protein